MNEEPRFGVISLTASDAVFSSEGDGPPAFTMIAYTGEPLDFRDKGIAHPVVIDLEGLDASGRVPILYEHDFARPVGHLVNVTKEPARLVVEGLISASNAVAREVTESARNGFPYSASIQAKDLKRVDFVKAGETARANGRDYEGPVYIARESTLHETSVVVKGRDKHAETRIAASEISTPEGITMSTDADAPKGETTTTTTETAPESIQASATTDAALEEIFEGGTEEASRRKDIRSLAASAVAEVPEMTDQIREIVSSGLAAGWDGAKVASRLDRLRFRAPSGINTTSRKSGPEAQEVTEAALCASAGMSEDRLEKIFGEEVLEASAKAHPDGLMLGELLIEKAREAGATVGNRLGLTSGKEALKASFATTNLPEIFSNVANKFSLAAYETGDASFDRFTRYRSVRDFKESAAIRLNTTSAFQKLGRGGELKSAELGEQKFTNKAETYGLMLTLTLHDIIDDDLGKFDQLATDFGRGARNALTAEQARVFLDNGSFFSTGNTNKITGASSALSSTSISSLVKKFRERKSPDGELMNVAPRMLVVPPALEDLAAQILGKGQFFEKGDTDGSFVSTNVHSGRFELVVCNSLGVAGAPADSTGSDTAFYLLASPSDLPVLETVVVNGQRRPTIETAEANFNTLGVSMRGYMHFGVALQDDRGGQMSAGA